MSVMTLKELGQSLREHREACGMSLDDVAVRIKLSTRLLAAIEDGATASMPHAVYTKRFIKSLGEIVGYDPDELNYKLELVFPPESLESRGDYRLRQRMSPNDYSGARHLLGMLFMLAVLAGLVAGGWFVVTNYGDDIVSLIKRPFSAVRPSTSEQVDDASLRGGNAAAPAAQTGQSSRTPPSSPASSSVVQGAGSGTSAALPAGGVNRLQLIATEDCWISSMADGANRREYSLRQGESFVLTYVNNLALTLSNAGAVTVLLNGKELGKAGNSGQRIDLYFPSDGS